MTGNNCRRRRGDKTRVTDASGHYTSAPVDRAFIAIRILTTVNQHFLSRYLVAVSLETAFSIRIRLLYTAG